MEFDSILFSYGSKPILRGIYLRIPQGSIIGLFGVNGSGKSTLIKIGAGVLKPDNGNIFIDKKVYANNLSMKRYNYIAHLSQDSFLPLDIRVNDLLQISASLKVNFEVDTILSRIRYQKIASLSVGEKRYLEIVLLFTLDRDYYLIDEPFTGLEPLIIERISNLLLEQKKLGKGLLITDHYHRYITEITDKSYLLNDGYISDLGNGKEELLKLGYLSS